MRCLNSFAAQLLLVEAVLVTGAYARGTRPATTPSRPVPQPIAFSHKQHCAANIRCVLCHQTAYSGEIAGLPTAAICMTCHKTVDKENPNIRKLAAYAQASKPIPWIQIYKVQDFVFFSHKKHADAKVACEVCHGQVCGKDVLSEEVHLSMMFCVKCHKAKAAPTSCDSCHTLSM